jgi:hypothetical protein
MGDSGAIPARRDKIRRPREKNRKWVLNGHSSTAAGPQSLGFTELREQEVVTMIDWDSDTWGGAVHLASDGSWVEDTHRRDDDPAG